MKALVTIFSVFTVLFLGLWMLVVLSYSPLAGEPHRVVALDFSSQISPLPRGQNSNNLQQPQKISNPLPPGSQPDQATQPKNQKFDLVLNRGSKISQAEFTIRVSAPPAHLLPNRRAKLGSDISGKIPLPQSLAPGLPPRPTLGENFDESAIKLAAVPVKPLVEFTRYGPLPKIANDGRVPAQIYARPSRYGRVPRSGEPPRIAILIHGTGLSTEATDAAIEKLPGQVTLSFNPYGRNLQGWVRKAREYGHEVMLDLPLEPFDYPDNDPGPHTLLTSLPPSENMRRLLWIMARFTGYTGMTNRSGAKFSSAEAALSPVLRELKLRGLIYLEGETSPRSRAGELANRLKLGYGRSQIVIDQELTVEDIDANLEKAEKMAIERGYAIIEGSALPITIERLAKWTGQLKQKNIHIIPVSAALLSR